MIKEFLAEFNLSDKADLSSVANIPLIEREPVKFWQGVSGVLLLVLISVLIFK